MKRSAIIVLALGIASARFATEHALREPGETASPPHSSPAGDIDFTAIDQTVDACEDFYRHACGGFIDSVELTPSRSRVSLPFDTFDRNLAQSLDGLFALPASAGSELDRVKTFYHSCLGDQSSTALLIEAWLQRIDEARSPDQLQQIMRDLSAIGVEPFFRYRGVPDPMDRARYVGEIDSGNLWQDAQVVERTFASAGLSAEQAKSDAQAVQSIISELRENSDESALSAKLGDLEQIAPSIEWEPYLKLVGADPAEPLKVTSPPYLAAVSRLISTRPISDLRAHLRWSFLFNLRGELPAPYNQAFGDVTPSLRVAVDQPNKRCRDATLRAMGVEFSRQYSEKVTGLDAREAVQSIASRVTNEIVISAQEAPWLSDAAREATAYKLRNTDHKLGFPDEWPEVGSFALSESDFLDNVMAARQFNQRQLWQRANERRSRKSWDMIVYPWVGAGPAVARLVTPNGFPDLETNSVVMTAAMLNRPFFDTNASVEANYASFGFIFGHEFVHIADTYEYGAFGDQEPFWSKADIASAKKQSQCVIDQADASPAPSGSKVSGEANYTENMADLGGLRLAYNALAKKLGPRISTPDEEGMTPAKRFFYKYAQINCTAATQDTLRQLVADDSHGLPSYRVNGPVSNLPAFSEAFGCKANARMRRSADSICRVW